jgi:hypothetical protein
MANVNLHRQSKYALVYYVDILTIQFENSQLCNGILIVMVVVHCIMK